MRVPLHPWVHMGTSFSSWNSEWSRSQASCNLQRWFRRARKGVVCRSRFFRAYWFIPGGKWSKILVNCFQTYLKFKQVTIFDSSWGGIIRQGTVKYMVKYWTAMSILLTDHSMIQHASLRFKCVCLRFEALSNGQCCSIQDFWAATWEANTTISWDHPSTKPTRPTTNVFQHN